MKKSPAHQFHDHIKQCTPLRTFLFANQVDPLSIHHIATHETTLHFVLTSLAAQASCPGCKRLSGRIHSHYLRHPSDLPISGKNITLTLNVRRFFCDNARCNYRIFTERFSQFISSYARYTNRLKQYLELMAFALGGEAGSLILSLSGISVSPDTLLRLIRRSPDREVNTPRVLGIDDWAKRKGHSYGTLLVDLEKRCVVDVLANRAAESLKKWLVEHPGVEIISRDRGVEYIKGATEGAPEAEQVADRWHLLKNLSESIENVLHSKVSCLVVKTPTKAEKVVHDSAEKHPCRQEIDALEPEHPENMTKAELRKKVNQQRRQEQYREIRKLRNKGCSLREISRIMNLSRKTVRKYSRAQTCPTHAGQTARETIISPHIDFIHQRLAEGEKNKTRLWSDLCDNGFRGSGRTLSRWIRKNYKTNKRTTAKKPKLTRLSPRRAARLFTSAEDKLQPQEWLTLDQIKQADNKLSEMYDLCQRFIKIMKEKEADQFESWLKDAIASGTQGLKLYAESLKTDLQAVRNAISLPWSNGQLEGQINRVKFIKRQMYGRANFDLLKKKILWMPMRP